MEEGTISFTGAASVASLRVVEENEALLLTAKAFFGGFEPSTPACKSGELPKSRPK